MVTILSYVERGKQPIWELTVSAAKYRSCIENEKAERTFSTISAFVVVRVVAQYRRSRDNKRCCSLHDRQFLFVHCIEQPVNMLAAVAFAVLPVRIKELVYGNIQQGDDLVKGVQAWMLAPVLKIHDGTRGTVYELCKVFLCPAFRLSLALDLPA